MNLRVLWKRTSEYVKIKIGLDKGTCNKIFLLFLLSVLIVSFIIPSLSFGRLFGTDEYTHLYHSSIMYSSDSLAEFYQVVGGMTSNPEDPNAPYTYPFATWLFAGIIAKITGLDPHTASFLFAMIFPGVVLVTFYNFAGLFLKNTSQKLLSLFFLLSMPYITMSVTGFRPMVFVLPFLFLLLYSAMKDTIGWKSISLMLMSVFIVTITHTGTFLFLLSFSIVFLFLYSLFWGKFSKSMYILSGSMLFVYVIAVSVFPFIHPQYIDKATMFLSPSDLMASSFNLFFADELIQILYTHLFVEVDFSYAILWSALIYALSLLFIFIHRRIVKHKASIGGFYHIAVLPTGLSHGLVSMPIWLGPIQVLLSCIGFFRLDAKGKCFTVAALLVAIFPELQRSLEDITIATGSLRNIYYLIIIIPILAVLGIDTLVSWLNASRVKDSRKGACVLQVIFILLFLSFIIIPAIGNCYYQPKVSGDDYVVDGMKWLSGIGRSNEGVVGYGLRMTPIFTQKDTVYSLSAGTETRNYRDLLRNILFDGSEKAAYELKNKYNIKYILSSEKIAANLGGSQTQMRADTNTAMDRIYSSKDFVIYSSFTRAREIDDDMYISDDIVIKQSGSDYIIISESYKLLLSANSPQINYIGTDRINYLKNGFTQDTLTINLDGERSVFILGDLNFAIEIKDNRIIYTSNLTNLNSDFIGTIKITYSFYTDTIQREYFVANDQLKDTKSMVLSSDVRFFSPTDGFVLFNDGKRIAKNIYPSEDGSWLDEKFNGIYLDNGDSGIYLEYCPTIPYPMDLYYSGSTVYDNYALLLLRQTTTLKPGTSCTSVQYITIGEESTARSRVERQRSVELYPYPYGIIPMGIIDELSGPLGYELPVVKALLEVQASYFIADSINPPVRGIFYDEGLRHPQMAIYQGKTTDLVLLPASYPPSTSLSREDPDVLFANWRAVINSVAKNDDIALFVFSTADIENPEYAGMFSDLIDYARRSGLAITTPETIADHYRKLQKVSFVASQEIDSVLINVTNSNPEYMSGVTFKVIMPMLEEGNYQVAGGNIERTKNSGDSVIIYASVNLAPHQTQTINIEPAIQRKEFVIDVPEYIIENEVSITVRGYDDKPISNAYVIVEGSSIRFKTDEDGILQIELPRGIYMVTIEKAGYFTQTFAIEVRGRIYTLHHIICDVL